MIDPGSIAELRSLSRTLDLSQASSLRKTRAAVRKSTLAVEAGAKKRAPVDTGFLRSSITSEFSGTSTLSPLSGTGTSTDAPIWGETGPEADYGDEVELGTWKMAPQPYLGPAYDEVEPSFVGAMDDIAGATLDGQQ